MTNIPRLPTKFGQDHADAIGFMQDEVLTRLISNKLVTLAVIGLTDEGDEICFRMSDVSGERTWKSAHTRRDRRTASRMGQWYARGEEGMSIDLAKQLGELPLQEPAKLWRNWWRSANEPGLYFNAHCGICGAKTSILRCSIFAEHCPTYPTRDLAETAVQAWLNNPKQKAQYLGAFPEGETP